MPEQPTTRLPYRAARRLVATARNLVRFRWRPFWLRRRLAWHCWGAGARLRVGGHLSVGRAVRVFLLPGGELILGDRVRLHDGVTLVIQPGARLSIGDGTYVGPGSEVHAACEVAIGGDCLLAGGVIIIDHNHAFDLQSPVREKQIDSRPVQVGDGCWLASRAVVTAGSRIGACCVIGAGAVVGGEIPAGSVAGGVPARILRQGSGDGGIPAKA